VSHVSSGTAIYDSTGRFRYVLTRVIMNAAIQLLQRRLLFICLNPSTATAEINDPTVRRCMGFAFDWSFGTLVVCNIFALRSTDPKKLYTTIDPVGPDNDRHILDEATHANAVVCAWGVHGKHQDRGAAVRKMLRDHGIEQSTLGTTRDGSPRHPLYLPKNLRPQPWP